MTEETVTRKGGINSSPSKKNMTNKQHLEEKCLDFCLAATANVTKMLDGIKVDDSEIFLFSLFFWSHLLQFQSSARLPKRTTWQMTR